MAHAIALDIGALTLFATHYFELTHLSQQVETIHNIHLDATEHNDNIIFLHRIKAELEKMLLREKRMDLYKSCITF